MIDIDDIIQKLAKERPIFFSEADFQHALAWIIHENYPDANIYPEFPIQCDDVWFHVDIFVRINKISYVIELKYNTRKLLVPHINGDFLLKDQSAQDIGRYDFIKDIQRLEHIVYSHDKYIGYSIMLTNDSAYWKPSARNDTIDNDFRLDEGRNLYGYLDWGTSASDGTKKNREHSLCLTNAYITKWKEYSLVPAKINNKFRYLSFIINKAR